MEMWNSKRRRAISPIQTGTKNKSLAQACTKHLPFVVRSKSQDGKKKKKN